jgi:tripartite-type tricarboxylate transporter receptor subunit TctC
MIIPHNHFARAICGLALVFAVAMTVPGAFAKGKGAADYYKGKTLTYIVSTGTGGGADYYGRLVTHHMKPFLAGTTIIVRNVPGAGHIIGANKIYHSKPNGLTIGSFTTGLTYAQIIQRRAVKYDLRKMSWLGKADTDIRVMFMSAKSPYRSFEDMVNSKRTIRFGTSGVGSGPHNESYMIANTFGVPIQVLPGYSGNERVLGMLRGEIDGHVLGLSSTEAIMVKHAGKIVLQFGDVLPNVPKARDVAKTKTAKAVVALMSRQSTISRFVAGPPNIVPERLALLRSVYKKTLESPALRADAKKAHRTIHPAYGEDVARMVKAIVNQPPEIVALLKKITNMKVAMLKHKGKVTKIKRKGRGIVIDYKGKALKAKLSGSRTTVTIDGKGAKRKKIKLGMTCQITWPRANGEAARVDCTK